MVETSRDLSMTGPESQKRGLRQWFRPEERKGIFIEFRYDGAPVTSYSGIPISFTHLGLKYRKSFYVPSVMCNETITIADYHPP